MMAIFGGEGDDSLVSATIGVRDTGADSVRQARLKKRGQVAAREYTTRKENRAAAVAGDGYGGSLA